MVAILTEQKIEAKMKTDTPIGIISLDVIEVSLRKLVATLGVEFYGYPESEFYGYDASCYGFFTDTLIYE